MSVSMQKVKVSENFTAVRTAQVYWATVYERRTFLRHYLFPNILSLSSRIWAELHSFCHTLIIVKVFKINKIQ